MSAQHTPGPKLVTPAEQFAAERCNRFVQDWLTVNLNEVYGVYSRALKAHAPIAKVTGSAA